MKSSETSFCVGNGLIYEDVICLQFAIVYLEQIVSNFSILSPSVEKL